MCYNLSALYLLTQFMRYLVEHDGNSRTQAKPQALRYGHTHSQPISSIVKTVTDNNDPRQGLDTGDCSYQPARSMGLEGRGG